MNSHVQPDRPPPPAEQAADHAGPQSEATVSLESPLLQAVQVELKVRLGMAKLTVQELLALKPGSVVKLESQLNDLVELRLNGSVVALGEIVAVGANFGVRIVKIAPMS
jgi:flagellar motor switch protein FliN/FliY